MQIAYEGFVQKLNQQHQTDLTELENRLKEFYTGECEKLQNIYIEEAEKYKTQLQEQVCFRNLSMFLATAVNLNYNCCLMLYFLCWTHPLMNLFKIYINEKKFN